MKMFRVIQKRTGRLQGYYHWNEKSTASHRQEILLLAFFLTGLLLGAFAVRKSSSVLLERLLSLFQNYTVVKSEQSPGANFCSALFREIVFLGVPLCVGLCAVGLPMLYVLPLTYGAGIGLVGTYLYKTYALKGIGYCALIFYPGKILSFCALVYACTEAVSMSRGLMQGLLQKESGRQPSFSEYCRTFLIAAVCAAVAAALETALYAVFARYFQFS